MAQAREERKWGWIMGEKDTGSGVYNVVAFCFDGQKTAKETFKEAKKAGLLGGYAIVVRAIVEKNKKGKVSVKEAGKGGLGATAGAVGGGLLSLIGGPAGLLAWTVGGAVVGGFAGKYLGQPIAKGDLKELGKALTPDSSALLLLLEDIYTELAVDSLSGYKANVVTLTMGDELSGQIAQFTAGAVSDDEGDVVAGADVAAATSD